MTDKELEDVISLNRDIKITQQIIEDIIEAKTYYSRERTIEIHSHEGRRLTSITIPKNTIDSLLEEKLKVEKQELKRLKDIQESL